jgi:hypothetical protein
LCQYNDDLITIALKKFWNQVVFLVQLILKQDS